MLSLTQSWVVLTRLQAVALNYVPLIKDNKIDLSRVNQITVTGTMEFGEITINTTLSSASKGIAWYNIDTLDIVLCYIEDLPIGAMKLRCLISLKIHYMVVEKT